jgi:replicative DNA helicase
VTSPTDHGVIVLAGIFPARRDLLDLALRRLTPAHFTDSTQANLFTLAGRYADLAGGVLTRQAVEDSLRAQKAAAGTIALHLEAYDACAGAQVSDDVVRWAIAQLRDAAAERATGEALTGAYEILTKGRDDGRGERLVGHEAARAHLMTAFAEIDTALAADAPEGDVRTEAADIVSSYAAAQRARAEGRATGIPFGIGQIDDKLGGGAHPGELLLILGGTGWGKSQLCVQLAWNAVTAGKNVVFFTVETLRDEVRARLIARHSRLPKFGLPSGLNSMDIKTGTLSPPEVAAFQQVLADFRDGGYGTCWVSQVPWNASLGTVESRLARTGHMFGVDLVIIDYLALLRADRKRADRRQELGEILQMASNLSATYNDGAGVPVVSPWQVNRSGRERVGAAAAGSPAGFSTLDLGDTDESGRTADVVLAVHKPEDTEGREAEIRLQIVKNRAGETLASVPVRADYGTCCFTSASAPVADGGILGLV